MGLFRKKDRAYELPPEVAQARGEIDEFRARMRREAGGSEENPMLKKLEQERELRESPGLSRQQEAEALMLQGGFNPYAAAEAVAKPYLCDDCGVRYQDRWGRCNKCGGPIVQVEEAADVTALREQHAPDLGNVRAMAPTEQAPSAPIPTPRSAAGGYACTTCGKEFREKWSRSPCCGSVLKEATPAAAPALAPVGSPRPMAEGPPEPPSFTPTDQLGDDPLAGLLDDLSLGEDDMSAAPAAPTPATPMPATPTPATPMPATPMPATPMPATPTPAVPAPASAAADEAAEEAPAIRQVSSDSLMDFGSAPRRRKAVRKRPVKRAVKRPVKRPR